MVTGFPGKSDCCIFPAVREQQVSGSLTPSPEPLGPSPSLDVEREFSSSNTKKSHCALPGHCCISARHCCHPGCPRGLPKQPTWSSGRAHGALSSHVFGDQTKLRAAGCKPRPPASLGARLRPGEPHGASGVWGQGPPSQTSPCLSPPGACPPPLAFQQQQIAGNEPCLSAS